MPAKIKILPPELVNKIAAGEVVERPVSVVKELVENSIDAEATEILVEIKSGGNKYVRVVDNGCGMSREDVELAFTHHATSKLSSFDDLNRILTMGFRGEALPSIALVSQLELVTKFSPSPLSSPYKGEETPAQSTSAGTQANVEGGQIKSVKETGAPEGTSITVRELFYNLPVRRKFLKSISSETKQIIDRITIFALAFPRITFKLKVDNKEILNLKKAEDIKSRIGDIFGRQIYDEMLELNVDYDFLQVKGFLGKPEIARPNRAELYLFVNQRNIFSKSLYHAILTGYKDLLSKGKFPWAVVYLNLPPELVDVNVHPTKKEVRFSNEKQMYEFVFSAVHKTLNTGLVIPVYSDIKEKGLTTDVETHGDASFQIRERPLEYSAKGEKISSLQHEFLTEVYREMKTTPVRDKKIEKESIVTANLWQLSNMYILTQVKGDLIVMDQHAAHERILYENALKNLTAEQASTQHLLFPIVAEFSPVEFMTFEENQELIKKLGFEVRPFGGKSILISGVPPLPRIQKG
ncbi:MAG: DNA mismatch repair endonuclease MutL, partial [candidate division Zixibacteria bacterium]|nr:DNA mismatch repair endonuclease MutL [candidate division Zixibacteria bacterium]